MTEAVSRHGAHSLPVQDIQASHGCRRLVGGCTTGVCRALALAGLSMSGRELGAAVSTVVGGTPQAPSARSKRTAVSVAVGVLFSLGYGLGVTYQVHTLSALNHWLAQATTASSDPSGSTCAAVDRLQAVLVIRVGRYLDGYFSLGGDYARLAMGLTGNLEEFLQTTFHSAVWQGLEGEGALAAWQAAHQAQWGQIQSVRLGMEQVLKDNRLLLEATHTRLAGAAAAGLSAGVLASALTAKVMAKASFQLSAKVLAKTLAAKAGCHAAGAMTGATVGAGVGSSLPVIGTAVGAAVSAVAGVVVGVGVDVAALALQEKHTRADMRADLMAAVGQTLQPLRDAFGCRR